MGNTVQVNMSLFDVDTDNGNRQSPAPNKVDQISADARMAHGTHSITNKVNESSGRRLITSDARHIASNGVNDLAIFGFLPNGQVGLKIVDSSLGVDVQDATDSQLTFNSNQNIFKIVFESEPVQIVKPVNTDIYSVEIPHDLGFQPAFLAFVFAVNTYFPNPFLQFDNTFGTLLEQTKVDVDSVNVYVDMNTPNVNGNLFYTSSVTRVIKYFLLQETVT